MVARRTFHRNLTDELCQQKGAVTTEQQCPRPSTRPAATFSFTALQFLSREGTHRHAVPRRPPAEYEKAA